MSRNKNNKNFQITLDPESSEILETLAERFKTTKSIIIKNALKVYASKKQHFINISYKTQWSNNDLQLENNKSIETPKQIEEPKPIEEPKQIENNQPDEDWDTMINDLEQITPPSSGHND